MEIVKLPLAELELDPQNARKHDSRSLQAIAESLKNFGQRKPVVITEKNLVVTGNGTVEAARSLGWTEIQAVKIPADWKPEKIKAFAIADNRTSELSSWNTDALIDQLANLLETEIEAVGFTQDELDDLLEWQQNPFTMVHMNISELKPHPENYQLHPDSQLDQIEASIRQHGFYRNVVVAKDKTILAGHGVVQAAKRMGKKRVPVIQLDIDSTDPKALKVMTSDNEINNLAKVNDRALTELLKGLLEIEGVGALMGTGFDENQLAALAFTTRPANELQSKDDAAEWVGMSDFEGKQDHPTVNVRFESDQDRQDFLDMIGATLINKKINNVWSIWYPERENLDIKSLRFVPDVEA
jgi:ParB-like chromosome segregation protein Spo0J